MLHVHIERSARLHVNEPLFWWGRWPGIPEVWLHSPWFSVRVEWTPREARKDVRLDAAPGTGQAAP